MLEGITMLLIGIIAGFMGSMLGLGGGFVIVPMFTLIFGIEMIKYGIISSLGAIVLTSLLSTLRYLRLGILRTDYSALLSIPTIAGAVIGSLILRDITPKSLSVLFGAIVLISLLGMLFRRRDSKSSESELKRKPLVIFTITIAGLASNLLGIGGGIVVVPALTLLGNLSIKVSIAISTSLMCFSSIIGVTNGYVNDYFRPNLALPIALGVALGAYTGPLATTRLSPRTLNILFVAVASYLAIRMILRGLGIYMP